MADEVVRVVPRQGLLRELHHHAVLWHGDGLSGAEGGIERELSLVVTSIEGRFEWKFGVVVTAIEGHVGWQFSVVVDTEG